jgi:hypothetical protein
VTATSISEEIRRFWDDDAAKLAATALAHLLAGGQQLPPGALGGCLHPGRLQQVVGCAQLLAGVDASALAAQPFAVEQMGAGEVRPEPGAGDGDQRVGMVLAQDAAISVQGVLGQLADFGIAAYRPERPIQRRVIACTCSWSSPSRSRHR